jgi:dipeptidyl aminopeptidase/acylaminoacyl peptidase
LSPVQEPYGTWPSPLAAATVAAQGLRLSAVAVANEDIYWLEGRPSEGGRSVIVRRTIDGRTFDVIPPGFNARTRVHEYGGLPYAVADGIVYFSNFTDQRIYKVAAVGAADAGMPIPITSESEYFYADLSVDARRRRLIAVREDHTAPGEPINSVVSIPLEGEDAGEVLASGYDFYATPRLSPDGGRLAWLAWRHPQMPWDGTELWVADVSASGALTNHVRLAGGEAESIYQPGWSPDGILYFVSDGDGWWRLYRAPVSRAVEAVITDPPPDAEFGRAQWVFGGATWSFADPSRIVCAYTQRGRWHLAVIDAATGAWHQLTSELEPREWLTATVTQAVLVAASATMADAVVGIDIDTGAQEIVRSSAILALDTADISVAEPVEFGTRTGSTAHAFYYAPRNSRVTAPAGERPPLIAIGHGGPTTATTATLDLRIQFWTTRGFAVVDVNYSGSTGYGRAYRERLAGQWGLTDVDDMVSAARHLVGQAGADPQRLVIRGGSAGGYTALAALTFHPGAFTAAASYYGISDLEVLARETHKFESRYLDRLVGPYPGAADVYRARSPIHYVDRIACPLILFQGLDDKVVPPDQSRRMADAVRATGLAVAYLEFEGEQHGFRKAETIVRSLEAELAFYGAVFGFEPADRIEPLAIDNLPARQSGAP